MGEEGGGGSQRGLGRSCLVRTLALLLAATRQLTVLRTEMRRAEVTALRQLRSEGASFLSI